MSRALGRTPSPATVISVVALSFALAGSAVAGTATLDRAITKSKVRQIAKKQAKKQARKAVDAAAPQFQPKANLLAATVAPADVDPKIAAGRGATAVKRSATGFYTVTFDRAVSGCTATATYGPPLTVTGVDDVWATVRGPEGGDDPKSLGVVLWDDQGQQTDGAGFHVTVLCP